MTEETHPDYPWAARELVIDHADERFREKLDEHGSGKNWLGDNPAWHADDAAEKLNEAADALEAGHTKTAVVRFGDALNRMAMATEIATLGLIDDE
ncbi:hypothetical protein [Halomarina oriensis]|uniref:Uncharacterized protein n=1 Tax=Halomarina oriensis TaxID=671145 RepID=A0A6B0GPC1_9EURY|nr:hypothetical protein [Halomarina oriensis]MWG36560.1 hypothetical protein [Halomarina oriensis]